MRELTYLNIKFVESWEVKQIDLPFARNINFILNIAQHMNGVTQYIKYTILFIQKLSGLFKLMYLCK